MTSPRRSHLVNLPAASVLLGLCLLAACKKDEPSTGLVMDAGPVATPVEAGPIDPSQCLACQSLTAQSSWSFQGVFRDAKCTEALAQVTTPTCAAVPALGPVNVTFAHALGSHKAGATESITLSEQVAPTLPRYRKAGNACVQTDEGAVALTPAGCAGQKVCRDASGALVCTGCRTLSDGCPDFEATRMYALLGEAGPSGGGGGGGGNLARLRQCCNALAAEAKRLGNSPEAGMIASAAAQCNALVTAAGPSGNAPEVGALKTALAGRKVPAVCAGF